MGTRPQNLLAALS